MKRHELREAQWNKLKDLLPLKCSPRRPPGKEQSRAVYYNKMTGKEGAPMAPKTPNLLLDLAFQVDSALFWKVKVVS